MTERGYSFVEQSEFLSGLTIAIIVSWLLGGALFIAHIFPIILTDNKTIRSVLKILIMFLWALSLIYPKYLFKLFGHHGELGRRNIGKT